MSPGRCIFTRLSMSPYKFVLLIVLTLLVVVFAVKNMDLVEISFYDFHLNSRNLRVPLLVVVLCSIAFGFMLSWMSGWISQMKQKALLRR
ncbi:MAG: lipopolysaccharide assembly protein LapA domain-containing protein, partial [Nitrospinaceae bacterium]